MSTKNTIYYNGKEYGGGAGGSGGESWITTVPEMHRNIFRGKNLGTSVSAAQLAAIADGSFDDLYVGDYWTINGVNWRIADFDYFCSGSFATHHANIVPDIPIDTVATAGNAAYGDAGCTLRTQGMETSKTIVNAAFPDMVLTIDRSFNLSTSPSAAPVTHHSSTVDPMSAAMIYGINNFGMQAVFNALEANIQFSLFRLAPKYIGFDRSGMTPDPFYWTVTPATGNMSGSGLLAVDSGGGNWSTNVSGNSQYQKLMSRPTFAIGVAEESEP